MPLSINNYFGQQRLNDAKDWSAAKGGQVFCILNTLSGTCQCRRALSRLYFNSSAVGQSVVRNKGCQALEGFPPKG